MTPEIKAAEEKSETAAKRCCECEVAYQTAKDELKQAQVQYLKQHGVLAALKWRYDGSDDSDDYNRQLVANLTLEKVPLLEQLYEVDSYGHYHQDLIGEDGVIHPSVTISFDDGEISLWFSEFDEDAFQKFVKEWNLEIDASAIQNQITTLEDQIAALKEKVAKLRSTLAGDPS